ncbi:hypothetical protein A4A49_29502 [Nicotiana attenuata]|uniref:Uncharacterized protein n=1 Tax=Nicotiana attenuata TaxID=49451 RepID=A0A314L676_NICAT|nr:hypothetical protein A4A49_29502 [Nicotiana attenuata]
MEDPYAGIIRNCATAANEQELCNCSFAVEFENFPGSSSSPSSSPVPSQHTGIIMLSLQDSDAIDQNTPHEDEEFQTPPEHHNSQTYISGSDDQRPTTATAVDLPANVPSGEDTAVYYGDRLDRIDEVEYSEGDFDEPLRKRIRVCEKNLGMKSSITQKVVDVDTEITDLECEEIVQNEVVKDNRMKRNVDSAVKEYGDGVVREDGENEKFNHIKESCNAGVDGNIRGRRELPLWMRGGEKNGGVEGEVRKKAVTKGQFKDIIEATFMVVVGEMMNSELQNADFWETAKRHGMCFPRPRWWPPE